MSGELEFDFIVRDARVIDGTGLPAAHADVAVVADRIIDIGKNLPIQRARRVWEANGRVLCPGFIDAHTHDDRALISEPQMIPKLSQGVTSVVVGNCGVSLAPLVLRGAPPQPLDSLGSIEWFRYADFSNYRSAVENAAPAVNVFALVGHTTLRAACMDDLSKPATIDEVEHMKALLDKSLSAGGRGLSSGLFYSPANAAPAAEVEALAKVAAEHGGIYTAHIRDEADDIMLALEETIGIAARAKVPLVLSHHKVAGRCNHGRTQQTLPYIARCGTHQSIGIDVYPYEASSTMLNERSWASSRRTLITWCTPMPTAAGRDLSDVARELNLTERETIARLQPSGAIFFMMDEADVQRILRYPQAMIGSDGLPHDPRPHPRLWGSFTRVLGHYVRDTGLLTLEEAIRRMTSLTATQFRLRDRGVLAPGAFADMVLLDPAIVAAGATWMEPMRPSAGIDAVWVNGALSWQGGAIGEQRAGRWL
jgi:N-acyl-D-amino-acid deacylase